MPAKGANKEPTPSWDDVREEASALTREMAHQSLLWSRRFFHIAGGMAEVAFSASKNAAQRAEHTVEKVRRH